MEISKVGVLGAGLMGHGIAQIAAQAGWDVVVREVDQEHLDRGIGRIEKQLARAVEKGRMEQDDADAVRGRIQGTLDYGDLGDSDLVVEAITEDLGMKLDMWRELDGIVKDGAVLTTNTSSLSVIDQAAGHGTVTQQIFGAAVTVKANSRNSRPMMPPISSSGMNTATSETLIDTTVKPISRAPSSAACIGLVPSSICR